MATRRWTQLIAEKRFDAIRADAMFAYETLDQAGAHIPAVTRVGDRVKIEWREDGKFLSIWFEPGVRPRWASGFTGSIEGVQFGDFREALPGEVAWFSPPRPKKGASFGNERL